MKIFKLNRVRYNGNCWQQDYARQTVKESAENFVNNTIHANFNDASLHTGFITNPAAMMQKLFEKVSALKPQEQSDFFTNLNKYLNNDKNLISLKQIKEFISGCSGKRNKAALTDYENKLINLAEKSTANPFQTLRHVNENIQELARKEAEEEMAQGPNIYLGKTAEYWEKQYPKENIDANSEDFINKIIKGDFLTAELSNGFINAPSGMMKKTVEKISALKPEEQKTFFNNLGKLLNDENKVLDHKEKTFLKTLNIIKQIIPSKPKDKNKLSFHYNWKKFLLMAKKNGLDTKSTLKNTANKLDTLNLEAQQQRVDLI